MKWISVEDRLPEMEGRYMTYCPSIGVPELSVWRDNRFSTDMDGYTPTHWAKIEPPKDKL